LRYHPASMPLRVFISYSHDNQEHMDRVWELSERLRGDGVDCRIDQQEESPPEGWPRWCRNQVLESQFVLVACTETYQRRYEGNEEPETGRGAQWEGFVITQQLYNAAGRNTKFVPIFFENRDAQFIPIELQGATYYIPVSDGGYEGLFGRITGQKKRLPSPVAAAVRKITSDRKPSVQTPENKSPSPKPSLADPNQRFNIPPENPFFTGREDVLEGLKATLARSGIAALTGLGGVGKTQTAAHYAHRHGDEYPWVLWVRAETLETLFSDLSQLAARLELPEREAREQSMVLDAVKRWLDEQERWLLVLDNVEDYGIVRDLTQKANLNSHHIIVTAQRQVIPAVERQRVNPMDRDHGALLLLHRANTLRAGAPLSSLDSSTVTVACEISDEVGGLPLALDQAGAYIDETASSLRGYLDLLRKHGDKLLDRRGELDFDHRSVAKTFIASFEKLQKLNAAAAELLEATAFLPPDAIPEEIFSDGAAEFGPELSGAASDPLKWNDAIGATLRYSLLERDPDKKLLAVHRMVQAVLKSRMNDEERNQRAGQVLRAVNAAFPLVEFETWPSCERLVPSAQACAGLIEDYGLVDPAGARLLNQAGCYLDDRARYSEAEPLYRRALAIDEKVYGPDHPEVATYLNNLALLLKDTNRLAEAEPLMRRALAIDEKALGPDHPSVAIRLNNLARLLKDTNRLDEAEPLMRRALDTDKKALGPDHPDVARDLNNLAQLLKATNRLAEAEPLMRRVVTIVEKAYGQGHPKVATSLNNLAGLLKVTNRLDEAEPLMRRALAIDEKAYGLDHPDVAIDLNNLAALLKHTNRLDEAEPLYRRALSIFEKSLGDDHPRTVTVRDNLALLLREMGKQAG